MVNTPLVSEIAPSLEDKFIMCEFFNPFENGFKITPFISILFCCE